MLRYLVTSKARRRLLALLWGSESARGSVAELADRAGVSFGSAHSELKAMEQVQLVRTSHEGGKDVYAANTAHPDAAALRALAVSDAGRPFPAADGDDLLKRELKAMGAPLRGVTAVDAPVDFPAESLLRGAALARRDPVVARSLPLAVWNVREALDAKALQGLSARPEEKHALGFFLELTSVLGGDRRLLGLAEVLRDGRVTATRNFFQSLSDNPRERATRDVPLAQKWGFHMNMDVDSFRTLFEKFVRR